MPRCPRLLPLTAAALLLLAACGDDGDSTVAATTTAEAGAPSTTAANPEPSTTAVPEPEGTVIDVEVAGGEPVGGAQQVSVDSGEQVTLRITADAPDEVHVHGYELVEPVGPGEPLELSFVADIPGQFEIELHDSGAVLVELAIG